MLSPDLQRIKRTQDEEMRNLAAHNYGSMNRDIIWEPASVDIPALKNFCEEQLSTSEL